MSTALSEYRRLQKKLARVRKSHGGAESPEEDAVLDEMDRVWQRLTPADRDALDRD